MASPYEDFVEDLAKASGKEKAEEALGRAEEEGAPVPGDADPGADIEAQAKKIAKAILDYLSALAGDEAYVKKPGSGT